jgi:hypothetical protein
MANSFYMSDLYGFGYGTTEQSIPEPTEQVQLETSGENAATLPITQEGKMDIWKGLIILVVIMAVLHA